MLLAKNFEWINNVDSVEFILSELEAADLNTEETYKLVNHINSQNEQIFNDKDVSTPSISFDGELLKIDITQKRKEFIIRFMKIKLAEQVRNQQLKDIVTNLYKNHNIKDITLLAKMILTNVENVEGILKNLK
jgi:hypothetical protein